MTNTPNQEKYDVIVVGGGNTGLITAIRAHEAGAKVLVLEKAPQQLRGGNGYFTTGVYRIVQNGMEDVLDLIPDLTEQERKLKVPPYSADDFYRDYMRITEGLPDPEMAELFIQESRDAIRWMVKKQGLKMELNTGGASAVGDQVIYLNTLPIQAKGGGAGLSDALYSLAAKKGIDILYETVATRLLFDDISSKVQGVHIRNKTTSMSLKSKSVILCCGGFEANPQWRAQYLGKGWDLVKVRGTRFNMGDGLRMAMDIGAQPWGNWSSCHAIFIDADTPQPARSEDTDKVSKRWYIFGLVVNVEGQRFVDEGEDEYPFTYARYGQTVISQPQRIAFQIFDGDVYPVLKTFADYALAPYTAADSIRDLADKVGINSDGLVKTVKEFNDACELGGTLAHHEIGAMVRENMQARRVSPPKSNYAFPLIKPPFYAFPICCGITFTYGGIKINNRAQVLNNYDEPIPGLYAAGEMVGGIFYNNYPGATGQCAGVVFGRIAGANAATD